MEPKRISLGLYTLFVMFFVLLVILFFFLGIATSQMYNKESKKFKSCENLTIEDTADCLRQEISVFYSYNRSNIGKKMSLEELKIQGGVCSHYSIWYEQRARSLGFIAQKVSIALNSSDSHMFTVISKDNDYCILDQLSTKCFNLS